MLFVEICAAVYCRTNGFLAFKKKGGIGPYISVTAH